MHLNKTFACSAIAALLVGCTSDSDSGPVDTALESYGISSVSFETTSDAGGGPGNPEVIEVLDFKSAHIRLRGN